LNPAQASVFMHAVAGAHDCYGSFSTAFTASLPIVTITIPKSAAVGDPVGSWYTNGRSGSGNFDVFRICTVWLWMKLWSTTIEPDDYLWVTGTKPPGVYESPDISSSIDVDGDSYTVWTTDALSDVGMGFILRWRAQATGAGVGQGDWRYPPSGWTVDVPPPDDGFPFYQATYIERWASNWSGSCSSGVQYPDFPSFAAFRNAQIGSDCTGVVSAAETGTVYYGAQVDVRYVLTKPASSIYSELNDNSKTITTDFVILKGRVATHGSVIDFVFRS